MQAPALGYHVHKRQLMTSIGLHYMAQLFYLQKGGSRIPILAGVREAFLLVLASMRDKYIGLHMSDGRRKTNLYLFIFQWVGIAF